MATDQRNSVGEGLARGESPAPRAAAEDFAVAESRNAGHPIGNARWEANTAADVFEYFVGAANKHYGDVVPVQDAGVDLVLREPVGVCGLIVPWNFPLLITTWKVAPALACGNPVIIKPASLTPITALMLAQVLLDAGLPPGAISVIPGPGRSVGDGLSPTPAWPSSASPGRPRPAPTSSDGAATTSPG